MASGQSQSVRRLVYERPWWTATAWVLLSIAIALAAVSVYAIPHELRTLTRSLAVSHLSLAHALARLDTQQVREQEHDILERFPAVRGIRITDYGARTRSIDTGVLDEGWRIAKVRTPILVASMPTADLELRVDVVTLVWPWAASALVIGLLVFGVAHLAFTLHEAEVRRARSIGLTKHYMAEAVAHEIKNKAWNLAVELEGKRRRNEPLPIEQVAYVLESILVDCEAVKRVAAFSEKPTRTTQEADLEHFVERHVADFRRRVGPLVEAEVVCDVPKNERCVSFDRDSLGIALTTLLDNAVKAKSPDEPAARVRVTITTPRPPSESPDARELCIAVRDFGRGLEPDFLDRHCVAEGRRGNGEGWGRGLLHARVIAEQHSGSLRLNPANTAPGKGAEFVIRLPVYTGVAPHRAPRS